jgi:sialate O-acetylesterase
MNRKRNYLLRALVVPGLLALLNAAPSCAEVRLPRMFSDNMVLQRNTTVPVWGWADRGEKVTLEFAGQTASIKPGLNGRWEIRLKPLKAGGPFEMKVSGKNTILIKNVLVGEVWLCSGQSNMAMEVKSCLNADKEMAAATYPRIRQFQVKRAKAKGNQDEVPAAGSDEQSWLNTWIECSPATVGDFTGVGYFFARDLYKDLDVPIGLIHSSWGGTAAEAWTCLCKLESDPELKPIADQWPAYNNDESWLKGEYEKFTAEAAKAKAEGKPAPLYFNQPAVLHNAMIAPLEPFAIRGALWYQGESNAYRAYQYRKLFQAMIENWREEWREGDFPFLFVQLANYDAGSNTWAELREAQTMALRLPNTGMAVITDIGEAKDIHPKNKQEVGRRLSLIARAKVYGEKLTFSGPLYRSMTVEGARCAVSFDYPGDGLTVRGGEALKGFMIAGADQKFVEAEAKIEGNRVMVWSDKVTAPVAVRYAWSDNPQEANLYNRIGQDLGLPASSFRTDTWPGLTANRKW